MRNRRRVRFGTKVIHRHRVGERTSRRVSELVFVRDQPQALLRWIDMGGDRTPVYLQLDPSRLRRSKGLRGLYYYDGVTVDPRFEDVEVGPEPARGRR